MVKKWLHDEKLDIFNLNRKINILLALETQLTLKSNSIYHNNQYIDQIFQKIKTIVLQEPYLKRKFNIIE